MIVLSWIILLFFILIQIICLWSINRPSRHPTESFETLPKVSILLAARNEERLILRSLKSIEALKYPSSQLEVLIGDDQSEDNTAQLVRNFIKDKKNFSLYSVTDNMGKSRGKANVLAHLAHKAKGDFYFITDVDVQLPHNWINELLKEFTPDVGIVSGTTTCQTEQPLFSRLQSIDWLHFMGYIQSFANLNIACTSVGNNMAVRAKAYWETGGYEHIDYSITEDYKLFDEVTKRGWKWRTILTSNSLGLATHITSWYEMLHQRKRWLIGAKELPLLWKILIVIYGLYLPALLIIFILQPFVGAAFIVLKFALQTIYIYQLSKRVKLARFAFGDLLVYEFYVLLNTFITAIFYFLPIKTVWKGRTYSHNDLK